VRRLLLALIAGAFLLLTLKSQEGQVVHEVRSPYQRITVQDTPSGYRQLIFDGKFDGADAIQSEMNLSDPYELTLSYARHIMSVLPLVEKPARILIVGLGGASMQRYLYRLLPEATIETAEIDPAVREVAAAYFFFREDFRQVVFLGDGRKFIENAKGKYDIIFLDAFSALSIPYTLTTQEFLKAVKEHLAPGGAACANLWDDMPEYRDLLKTYDSVFAELHIVKCYASGNSILIALPDKAGLTVPSWVGKAEAFEKKHPTGLDLPRLIERGAAEALPSFSSARILLDNNK
jgi:spermidine synthase